MDLLSLFVVSLNAVAAQPQHSLTFETTTIGALPQTIEAQDRAFRLFAPRLVIEETTLMEGQLKELVHEVARAQIVINEFQSTELEDNRYSITAVVSIKDNSMAEFEELLTTAKMMSLQYKAKEGRHKLHSQLQAQRVAIEQHEHILQNERVSVCQQRLLLVQKLIKAVREAEGHASRELIEKEKSLLLQCNPN